jgi:hypothetical protein
MLNQANANSHGVINILMVYAFAAGGTKSKKGLRVSEYL